MTPFPLVSKETAAAATSYLTYVHRDHEAPRLWSGDFGLVHRDGSDKCSNPKAVDEPTNYEHGIVYRASTDSSTDGEDEGRPLNGLLPAVSIGEVGATSTADGRASSVYTWRKDSQGGE